MPVTQEVYILVRIPRITRTLIKVAAACSDTTMQDYVAKVLVQHAEHRARDPERVS